MTHPSDQPEQQDQAGDRLPALYAELERLGREAADWAQVEASESTSVVHVGSADPERLREQMVATRREASERAAELQTAADEVRAEIQREVDRQRAAMEARMREAMAALEPLREQVKRMEEGIWTVNLYLGTAEEVVTLATGQPADIETPITLRTSVLAMDEEVAAFPVEHGQPDRQGMDFRDVETFDAWLTENPAHLAQVLPEPRGIVVFTPRRTSKVYSEDPFVNTAMNERNFESYWLIRNGENLYRLRTNFKVGRTLMPVSAEFTALFRTTRYNPATREQETVDILPGTRDWEKAEQAQDAKRRHYMRVALIVQGLIDRTDMFAPLHPAVNVMQQSTYDTGLVVVLNDTEQALTTSREPYYAWIRRLNQDLRPGMRLIGDFGSEKFADHPYDWRTGREDRTRTQRLSPQNAEAPASHVIHYIEGRRDGGFVIRYQRTKEVYDPKMWVETRPGWGYRGGYRVPEKRASALIYPSDKFVIPFDLVTEAQMQEYLDARTERHAYADSFPLLQAAIAAKRDEAAAEAPFRDLLARVLAEDTGQTPEDVAPHLDDLVHRFKVGNKWHRPLVSLSQEDEAKALRLIRAEYQRIAASGATADRDTHAVETLRTHDPEVMFVGRLSSGRYVAFAPMPRTYPAGAAHPDLWVREHTTTKTARNIKTRDWVVPGTRVGKMTTLFETDRWTGWDRHSGPADDLTDPELDALHAEVTRAAAEEFGPDGTLLAVAHDRTKKRWTAWGLPHPLDGQVRDTSQHVTRPGALYARLSWTWHRPERGQNGTPTLEQRRTRFDTFELSYGGNRLLGSGRPAERREVYMPWRKGTHRHGFHNEANVETTPPTVVHEADAETLAAVVAHVRSIQSVLDARADRDQQIRLVLADIEAQQVHQKTEAIKADFLTQYPDEAMWAEKRETLTKGLTPDLKVTDTNHFLERYDRQEYEGGMVGWSLREREGYRPLRQVLVLLDERGHTATGLSVRDTYRLADEPWPEVYDPIANLRLRDPRNHEDDAEG